MPDFKDVNQAVTPSQKFSNINHRVPPHPLGVKPTGNALLSQQNAKNAMGRFSQCPDELLVQILEFLPAILLVRLGATCKAFYAFCALDDLWKALFIR